MAMQSGQQLVQVVSYDPSWPQAFALEAERIKKAMGDNCLEVHHIGSTSVPDLAAKPVIDMMPVVADIGQVDEANARMQALGYAINGEYGIPFRRYFHKGGSQRTHHIHAFEAGHVDIERHLKFRDWMRIHAEDRETYARLKQDLARQYPKDIMAYCLGKERFIAAIDKKAGFNGLRVVKALTPREWEAVRHFRQFYFFAKQALLIPTPGRLNIWIMCILYYFKAVTSLAMPICNYGPKRARLCVSLSLTKPNEISGAAVNYWLCVKSGSNNRVISLCILNRRQRH